MNKVYLLLLSFFLPFCLQAQESIGPSGIKIFDFALNRTKDKVVIPNNNKLESWDLKSKSFISTFNKKHTKRILSVAFSNDNRFVSSGGQDSLLVIWDSESGEALLDHNKHEGVILAVTFTLDDKYVLSAGSDRKIILTDLDAKESIFSFKGHTDDVLDIEVIDNDRFISSGADGKVIIWSLSERKKLFEIEQQKHSVRSLDFLLEHKLLLVSGDNGVVSKYKLVKGPAIVLVNEERVSRNWITTINIIDEKTFSYGGLDKRVGISTNFGGYKKKTGYFITSSEVITENNLHKILVGTMSNGLLLFDTSK